MVAVGLGVVIVWPWNRELLEVASHDDDDEAGEQYFVDAGTDIQEELPETLSREQVRDTLREVAPIVSLCGKGKAGTVRVHLTIAGKSGAVTEAIVSKAYAGSEVAKCATGIVGLVQFPRFAKKSLNVVFPFQLAGSASPGAHPDAGVPVSTARDAGDSGS